MRTVRILAAFLLAAVAAVAVAGSSDVVLDALLQRPSQAQGTAIVPDRFLRSWDPVTVFFTSPRGQTGPEDAPQRFVKLDPPHPGAWTWLDPRTLQFRPAEPWTPLDVVTVRADGQTAVLSTLLAPPIASEPEDGADGLEPVESVSLTFAEPVDPAILARMTTIEVRALPGLGDGPATRLRSDEFEVKVLDRANDEEPARYAIVPKTAIPSGRKVVVRLGLSLDEGAREAVAEIGFRTAEPFRPAALGCDDATLPVSPAGTLHPSERPLRCTGRRGLRVVFTAPVGMIGPVEGRNLVRLEPSVEGLEFRAWGNVLQVDGPFRPDVPYKVALAPTGMADRSGRPLEITGPSEVWLYFPRREPYLRWGIGQGIAELKGPKRVPVEGRGLQTADVRLYRVDALNRELWPFPDEPITVDESVRPPGPGEEADPWTTMGPIPPHEIRRRLTHLGSPVWSGIVDLPLAADAGAARFGLDLEPMLDRAGGKEKPGHWLVGLRRLDGGTGRDWVRVQVTDLALTAIENPRDVWFEVSSLSTGAAVAGATIRVQGAEHHSSAPPAWTTLYEGRTGSDGSVVWTVPGSVRNVSRAVGRIVVQKGDDILVLDPSRPPDRFVRGTWLESHGDWLQWAFQDLAGRGEAPRTLVHLFPERPVYKPGDEVHLKGYLRTTHHGKLDASTTTGTVIVTGPGDAEWRLPVEVSKLGSFHVAWKEDEPPTGAYQATLELPDGARHGGTSFLVEAYRLPTFEVDLAGPQNADTVGNDAPFDVTMTASYYAGGRVAARPVRWRVTQYPYAWTPAALEGFAWSSDDRYARGGGFRATPELSVDGTTTTNGEASLSLDPGVEADARPRTYVVEATVTGADDQTVTSTLQVHAVPAFVLGVKVPRFLDRADAVPAELVAMGPDGKPVAGVELSVKLLQRQWHSVLQASDFTDGVAKYVTDVVDAEVSTRTVRTEGAPVKASLPISEAGVYLVEVEALDKLGRAQVVRVDLYAGGDEALSWEKPEAGTFDLAADADRHRPGQVAKVLVKSPFQTGEAIVVVEAPDRNRYQHVPVRGGKATIDVTIGTNWVPRVPVHVLVRRGRADAPRGDSDADLGKPQSVSSTLWLNVEPVENRVEVSLTNPERALPGETVPITVKLRDPDGRPLAGEVTLWLVDQAVLALGREQRLDPLPDFVVDRGTFAEIRDTRNLALGRVPTVEMPGGDGESEEGELLDRATVRKDFKAVAFYDPAVMVPASGEVTVRVKLPDNLTIFKLRAKAISGEERFGFGTGQIAVRLPVVVQPALPRFVRPGDRFEAAALARIVEGDGGAGTAQIRAEGLTLGGETSAAVTLDQALATRLAWPVTVPTPPIGEGGEIAYDEVVVRIAAERTADHASDAVEARLPLRDDRAPRYDRVLLDLAAGASGEVPALPEEARKNSVRRTVVVAGHPGLVRMASALDVLRRTPGNGTDAVVARARVAVGLGSLRGPLGLEDDAEQREIVEAAQAWLPTVLDARGLVANWPGGRGTISLTADTLAFLAEAREVGYAPDERLVAALERSLQAGLRSDYAYFLDGESWAERTNALWGLTVNGRFEEAWFNELARNSRLLVPESKAKVLIAASRAGQLRSPAAVELAGKVSDEVVVELYRGAERYAGLKSRRTDRTPYVFPSEAREVATLLDALVRARPDDGKLRLVEDALVRLGTDDGWGQPNADAAALIALGNRLAASEGTGTVALTEGSRAATLSVAKGTPVARSTSTFSGATALKHTAGDPLAAVAVTRWIPVADGAQQAPEQRGFVVEREWLVVRADGPADRTAVAAGGSLAVQVGDVIEEHVRVVNPDRRFSVVVTVPLAAGLEPLNPALATAPPEARPANRTTASPTWTSFGDDRVLYAFDELPKGTYDFFFRTKATVAGSFVQPAATAEMVYDRAVIGLSAGSRVEVAAVRP